MNGVIIIEGHVQGLSNTRALGEAGIPVVVIDRNNCLARYSKYCRKFFYCPDFISEEFTPFLVKLAQKENLRGWVLMPSNDHAVFNISKNKEELEKYYKIIAPDAETLGCIYDKARLLALANRLEVPIPSTKYFSSEKDPVPEGMTYPLITKGRNGLSFYREFGRKAFICETENELRGQLRQIAGKYKLEDTFTQEIIPSDGSNKTISFTAFCINGDIKTHWIGEKLREHPIRFGTATFARSILCPLLIEPGKRIIRELRYTGVCEIEFLLDPRDNKYKLIEINARTWLWVSLARRCGVDYALMIFNHLNGIPVTFPAEYQIGVNWVNLLTDIPFSMVAILKCKLSLRQYFSSFKGDTTYALFNRRDLKPGIMYFFLFVYVAIKRH